MMQTADRVRLFRCIANLTTNDSDREVTSMPPRLQMCYDSTSGPKRTHHEPPTQA